MKYNQHFSDRHFSRPDKHTSPKYSSTHTSPVKNISPQRAIVYLDPNSEKLSLAFAYPMRNPEQATTLGQTYRTATGEMLSLEEIQKNHVLLHDVTYYFQKLPKIGLERDKLKRVLLARSKKIGEKPISPFKAKNLSNILVTTLEEQVSSSVRETFDDDPQTIPLPTIVNRSIRILKRNGLDKKLGLRKREEIKHYLNGHVTEMVWYFPVEEERALIVTEGPKDFPTGKIL